ncbi:MAG: hypothetical protein JWO89_3399, partial [Verrucomicrobiaceae bacterium]|nr:hypothetical protein [Verrucomicrobiaceae bacterium]
LTYTIFVGNLSDVSIIGSTIFMHLPMGTTYVSSTAYYYNGYSPTTSDHNDGNLSITSLFKAQVSSAGNVAWYIGGMGPGEGGVVTLTVKVPDSYAGGRIDDNTCSIQLTNGNGKTPGPLGVVVVNGNDPSQAATATQSSFEGMGGNYPDAVRTSLETKGFSIGNQSYNVTTGGCDAMHMQNDAILIPLKSATNLYNRVMLVGPKAVVKGEFKNSLIEDAIMRVVVGPGEPETAETAVDVKSMLADFAGPTAFASPNSILSALAGGALVASGGGNLVASGGGNLVASGGGNLVASGGGNLVASGGGNFASINASALILLPANALIDSDAVGGRLVASGGGNLVASGGGNLVASGGGNLVASGGGNLISQDGGGLVAKTVNALISQDGGGLQMAGANNLFSSSTGNLVSGKLVNQ